MFFAEEEIWLWPGDPRWSYDGEVKWRRPVVGIDYYWVPTPIVHDPVTVPVVADPRKRNAQWAASLQRKLNDSLLGRRDPREVEAIVGYSMSDLKKHLERQFSGSMRWSNYAGNNSYRPKKRTWVIDHIVAKSRFKESNARAAFALTNLRPLWIDVNMRKSIQRLHLL